MKYLIFKEDVGFIGPIADRLRQNNIPYEWVWQFSRLRLSGTICGVKVPEDKVEQVLRNIPYFMDDESAVVFRLRHGV
jgi:hypothetical protein